MWLDIAVFVALFVLWLALWLAWKTLKFIFLVLPEILVELWDVFFGSRKPAPQPESPQQKEPERLWGWSSGICFSAGDPEPKSKASVSAFAPGSPEPEKNQQLWFTVPEPEAEPGRLYVLPPRERAMTDYEI